MPRIKIIVIAAILTLVGSVSAQTVKISKNDLKAVAKNMAGEFNSEEQSMSDKAYFHIKLRMKPIWSSDKDGYWYYVEQAMADTEDKPYRQRVYHLTRKDDSVIESKVFEIKDAVNYIGAWRDEGRLKMLGKVSLVDRQGCSIFLHKNADGTFSGSTPGHECLSSLRGATYATSEVTILADRMISWDRGWDKNDKQVWGAVKGGYIFKKAKSW